MAEDRYDDLYSSEVVAADGRRIGPVGQVYLDDATGVPTWVTVKTGLFGTRETFVPLQGAVLTKGQIQVPFAEAVVKSAPGIDPDRHLDAEEEAELYAHYEVTPQAGGEVTEEPAGGTGPARRAIGDPQAAILTHEETISPAPDAPEVSADAGIFEADGTSTDAGSAPTTD